MKKKVTAGMAAGLVTLLCVALSSGVMAEEADGYRLGDSVENFVITTFSDESVSLDELLEEKEIVLVNVWSSWSESSDGQINDYMKLCEELGSQIAVLELTSEAWDTVSDAEDVWMTWVEAMIPEEAAESLIAGEITGDAGEKFLPDAYPATYLIDQNHTICFIYEGAVRDMNVFREQLTEVYLKDSYGESVLMEALPETETVTEEADEAQLGEVLTAGQMEVTVPDETPIGTESEIRPFLISEKENAVYPSNLGEANSLACLKIDFSADAGSLLALDYRMELADSASGSLLLHLDDRLENTIQTTSEGWETAYLGIRSSGTHEVYLSYFSSGNEEDHLQVANVRLITGQEAENWRSPLADAPKNLEDKDARIELLDAENAKKMQNTDFDETKADVWMMEGAQSVRLQIQVGEAFNLNNAYLMVNQQPMQTEESTDSDTIDSDTIDPDTGVIWNSNGVEEPNYVIYCLKELEWDEDGFYLDLPLTAGTNIVTLQDSILSDSSSAEEKIYTVLEAPAMVPVNLMSIFMEDIADVSEILEYLKEIYIYEDGTPLYSDDEWLKQATGLADLYPESTEDEAGEERESAVYTLSVRNELDKPVEGVTTQWYDEDGNLQTIVTDADGNAVITGVAGDYMVHILTLPNKYAAVKENLNVAKDETEQTLIVYYR